MSTKLAIEFMDGFRLIQESDVGLPFRTQHPRMDIYDLVDYFSWSLEPDSMSLVKQMIRDDGILDIAAVANLTIHSGYIKVEMLGRNKVSPGYEAYKGSGFDLLQFIERRVASANRFLEVRLDAIEGMVENYRVKGYSEIRGEPAYTDPEWGLLTPMRKLV